MPEMPQPAPLPPRRVGRLPDVVLDLGGPPAVLEAAPAFAGEALVFSVAGAGAAIDPRTGRLTLPADRLRSSTRVSITARNAAGRARLRLRVTVEAPEPLVRAITAPAAEVSRDGVTFRFAAPRPVGRYVTGDVFVVGPVTITAIEPASAVVAGTARHGAQLDPGPEGNGFDGRITRESVAYDPGMNRDPGATGRPLTVATGTVVKAVSRTEAEGPAQGGFVWIDRYVTLTVVAEPPPAGSFRPAVHDPDTAPHWHEGQLRYDRLAALEPVAAMPTLAAAAEAVRPLMPAWFAATVAGGDAARHLHAARHFDGYGRDMGWALADAMLATHRAAPRAEKRAAVLGLVQAGLDLCAQIAAGRPFGVGGAITTGRKPVAVYAAVLLDDPDLLALVDARRPGQAWGNADRQYLWITKDLVGPVHDAPSAPDRPAHTPYAPEHIGFPEWRENDTRLTASLAADYRHLAGEPEARGLFALLLLQGGAEAWGDPLPFAYADRVWRWYQGEARNRWSLRGDPPWRMSQRPPRWVLVWHAAHRARGGLPEWQGRPEQMWPPTVAGDPAALAAEVRPDAFQCPNGGELLRVDLRWRMAGADRWELVEGIGHRHRLEGLSGATRYELQTRAVSTLGAGAWSTNLPRLLGGPPQAVLTTPPIDAPPVLWMAPTLVGRPEAGARLTVWPGLWAGHPAPDFTFRWERIGPRGAESVPGATGAELVPGPDLTGAPLRCVVTARNHCGAVEAASAPTPPLAPG